MPSHALQSWQNDRLPRLNAIDAQCDVVFAQTPPNPDLADEDLRGYVMLLSAHFQGYCRDLHTECVQFIATADRVVDGWRDAVFLHTECVQFIATAAVTPAMELAILTLGTTGRQLDGANPRFQSIREDFDRFGFSLAVLLGANPANAMRLTLLDHLNKWRNYAAHHKTTPPPDGGPFTLATVRA